MKKMRTLLTQVYHMKAAEFMSLEPVSPLKFIHRTEIKNLGVRVKLAVNEIVLPFHKEKWTLLYQ